MKNASFAALLALAVVSAAWGQAVPTTAPAAPAADKAATRPTVEIPVRRVVLFSSGVGFFQHQGLVMGNATTELRFKTDQINDILKSLLVSDRDAGIIRSINYPSLDPVTRTLRSFQIDISNNPPLNDLLQQIRGSKVAITVSDESIDGTILGVESKDRTVGKADNEKVVATWYVNLITPAGIRSVSLDDIKKLDIKDETLTKELGQALAALAQARDKDKKPVIIQFDGPAEGHRRVAIGYLVETPIWKTSYRLILPEIDSKDQAKLLGWAIIENQTDNDWNDVTLDLVGGRPLSFIENLYQPLYVPRPVSQPNTYASLRPQTYDQGLDSDGRNAARLSSENWGGGGGAGGTGGGGGGGLFSDTRGGRLHPPQFNLQQITASGATSGGGAQKGAGLYTDTTGAAPETPPDYTQGVASVANAAKVGEMFQYSVPNVSLPRQRSAMIPIVTEAVEFDRLSIYNAAVLAKSPLYGIRLKNKTGKYLLSGPITVLDMTKGADGNLSQSYAGDARIDDVPLGQERLLSYGIDQDVLVDPAAATSSDTLMTATIAKGVLKLKLLTVMNQEYLFQNKAGREKTIVLEHPVTAGFELKDPAKPLEKTDTLYRFQTKVPAKATGKFVVRQERERWEEQAILPMNAAAVEYFVQNGAIPQKVRDVLSKAAELRRTAADFESQRAAKDQDRTRALQEQGNTRENIRVLEKGTKSYEDAVKDLVAKDAEVKELNKAIKDLRTQADKARADLESFLLSTTIE
jgi:hypothetical protein